MSEDKSNYVKQLESAFIHMRNFVDAQRKFEEALLAIENVEQIIAIDPVRESSDNVVPFRRKYRKDNLFKY